MIAGPSLREHMHRCKCEHSGSPCHPNPGYCECECGFRLPAGAHDWEPPPYQYDGREFETLDELTADVEDTIRGIGMPTSATRGEATYTIDIEVRVLRITNKEKQ
jgi:hypothetical protein